MNTTKTEKTETIYDIGTRKLNEDTINQLTKELTYLYEAPTITLPAIERATKKLSLMLYNEDINFESSLQLFGYVGADFKILEDAYNNPDTNLEEINSHSFYNLSFDNKIGYPLNQTKANQMEATIRQLIQKDPFQGMLIAKTGSDTNVINDSVEKEIKYRRTKIVNGKDLSSSRTVVRAYLKELIVYDSPLSEDPRRVKAIFESKIRERPIKLGPALIEDITTYLKESGYVEANQLVKDALPSTINAFIASGKATMKTEIEYPGFFYDSDKDEILVINYEVKPILKEELKEGLLLFEEFAVWFEHQKIKLAHVFKWGLISPFIYAMKQKGHWVRWQFLVGKGGSGKTTMGKLILYIWGEPDGQLNDIGGSAFNSEARAGVRLQQFTYPLVVNEPKGAFENIPLVEMIKSAIERITSRGKFEGRTYKNYLALAPVVFTSNKSLPADDALLRRLDVHTFSYNERKAESDKEAFEKRFKMEDTTNSELHKLKPIANFVAQEIIEDPNLLDMPWRELINTLIVRMYLDVGLEAPDWILKWNKTESLDDMDDLQKETIRIFLQSEINKAYGRIEVLDEDGHHKDKRQTSFENIKSSNEFSDRVWTVLNERLIPWMLMNKKEEVILTSGFVDALKNKACIDESMHDIGQMLNWTYKKKQARDIGFNGWCIHISRENFTKFVFPSFEIKDTCDNLESGDIE